MKFLHSPSSSSEIRPNYSFPSCFPTVLRRLLCFHSLSTLPFDHQVKESYVSNEFDDIYCDGKLKGNPGIVAKLMGLDSMPVMDQWRELGLRRKGGYVCRAPSFVELENEKFIILSFEGGGKDKELKLNSSKTQKGLIELKMKTRNKKNQEIPICQSPENDGIVMNSCQLLDSKTHFNKNSMKLCDKECAEKGRSRKKVQTESDSENSSPVSVLEFPGHQENSYSGKEDTKSKNSNSSWKLRGDLDNNAPSPSPRSSCNSMDDGVESSRKGERFIGLNKNNFVIGDIGEMWEEICKMAERDVMDSSRVLRERWNGEDYEEIGVSFELQILDQLILELFIFT